MLPAQSAASLDLHVAIGYFAPKSTTHPG